MWCVIHRLCLWDFIHRFVFVVCYKQVCVCGLLYTGLYLWFIIHRFVFVVCFYQGSKNPGIKP